MTTVLTRPSALLHTSSDHLRHLFGAVLAHAAVDDPDDPPMQCLTQVHIEVRDGNLRLVCSDRYTMGLVRQPMTSTSDDFATSFAVPVEDVRSALESVDGASTGLIVEENTLLVASKEIPGVKSELPWRRALDKVLVPHPTPTGHIALNPEFLARLQAAKPLSPGTPMLVRMSGEHGSIIATLGETFLGLVMPIRDVADRLSAECPLDVWFDLIDEEPTSAGGAS